VGLGQGALESMAVRGQAPFGGAFSGKTVLVTGHTGFKGSWLCLWLRELGAEVVGYALRPDTKPSLFEQLGLSRLIESHIGDVRDLSRLRKVLKESRPEIVFHLAAQPIVRLSYERPVETFSTNVLGTVHLLEAVRKTDSVRVCQIITSDKCYENREWDYAYRESDRLGGHDPYSASKACAEIVTASYRDSFFQPDREDHHRVCVSSVRAGNVIGGGDWAMDRILPDCVRALSQGKPILVRNPKAVRPWQHVLEPLSGYLRLCSLQLRHPARYAQAWNFGPMGWADASVGDVADMAVRCWGSGKWVSPKADKAAPHEAKTLKLDCSKARDILKWRPIYTLEESVVKAVEWYRDSFKDKRFNALDYTRAQIREYVRRSRDKRQPWAVS